MARGSRHVEHMLIGKYAEAVKTITFPSGERRIAEDPPKETVQAAFDELGTHNAVASAFGVSRWVVNRWLRDYALTVTSRPELGLANYVRRHLASENDQTKVAQWIMDEGSISVAFFKRTNLTSLVVCGSMNDFDVLSGVSTILSTPITTARVPKLTVLPLGAIKIHAAKAYALLDVLKSRLCGLKGMEAKAALEFFPVCGSMRGRHTTDKFLVPVWREYAYATLRVWNSKRRAKMNENQIREWAASWLAGRIRRARRFVGPSRTSADVSR